MTIRGQRPAGWVSIKISFDSLEHILIMIGKHNFLL